MLEFIKIVIMPTYIMIGIGVAFHGFTKTQEEAKRKNISKIWRGVEVILITLFWPALLFAGFWKALDKLLLSEFIEEYKDVQE